jgi:hypothetical protein
LASRGAFDPVDESTLDEIFPPERLISILDADGSQRRCILAVKAAKCFVMDGPPKLKRAPWPSSPQLSRHLDEVSRTESAAARFHGHCIARACNYCVPRRTTSVSSGIEWDSPRSHAAHAIRDF